MQIDVLEAKTRAQRRAFLRLPAKLYANEPAFPPPLSVERALHMRLALDPALSGVEMRLWLARKDGRIAGRISSQMLTPGIRRMTPPPFFFGHDGFFGYLDTEDDPALAAALLKQAETDLAGRGARRIFGPFNPTTNFEAGLLAEGFETTPAYLMPYSPPHLSAHVEAAGYGRAQDLLVYRHRLADRRGPGFARLSETMKAARARLTVRPLDTSRIDAEMDLLADIFNDSWKSNWGFVPMTRALARKSGRELKPLIWPGFANFALLDGEPVAVALAVPDMNDVLHRHRTSLPRTWAGLAQFMLRRKAVRARAALMGVRQSVQRSRWGLIATAACCDALQKGFMARGIAEAEFSWILDDNRPARRLVEYFWGADEVARYRVYEKAL